MFCKKTQYDKQAQFGRQTHCMSGIGLAYSLACMAHRIEGAAWEEDRRFIHMLLD